MPVILSKFSGIRLTAEDTGEAWGYDEVTTPEALLDLYGQLIEAISQQGLVGFYYTQLTDTFQEANGLHDAYRQPKANLEKIHYATTFQLRQTRWRKVRSNRLSIRLAEHL